MLAMTTCGRREGAAGVDPGGGGVSHRLSRTVIHTKTRTNNNTDGHNAKRDCRRPTGHPDPRRKRPSSLDCARKSSTTRAASFQEWQPVRSAVRDTVRNTDTATSDSTCAFRGTHAHAYYIGCTCTAVGGRRGGVEQLLLDGPRHGARCCALCDTLPAGGEGAKSSSAGRNRRRRRHGRRREWPRRPIHRAHAAAQAKVGGARTLYVPGARHGLHRWGRREWNGRAQSEVSRAYRESKRDSGQTVPWRLGGFGWTRKGW